MGGCWFGVADGIASALKAGDMPAAAALLTTSAVPNQNFYGHKNTPDINYVKVVSPSGAFWLLTDMTPARGTVYLKAPAA